MTKLSQEAKLADEVSSHCGISTNAILRIFYALKDLGWKLERAGRGTSKPTPKSEVSTEAKDDNTAEGVPVASGT